MNISPCTVTHMRVSVSVVITHVMRDWGSGGAIIISN